MPIRRLSVQLANQIAAGEVVERPASVVKELLENAIDAKASSITLEIKNAGKMLIKVSDNGVGIPKDELTLALAPHATSKIHTLDDLDAIMTLGFRGEALATIASVSKLTLVSCTKDQPHAYQVEVEGPEQTPVVEPAAHGVGTSVIVRELFFNTPARRRFLKSDKTEFTQIKDTITKIALVNYDVEFKFISDGKVVFQVPRNTKDKMGERIGKLLGSEFKHDLLSFDNTNERFVKRYRDYLNLQQHAQSFEQGTQDNVNPFSSSTYQINRAHYQALTGGEIDSFDVGLNSHVLAIHGVLLRPPANNRSMPDKLLTFLNGRCIADRTVNHAIRTAYLNVLQERLDIKPCIRGVIFMECDPHIVDVNVHPRKDEVRFHNSNLIHDSIVVNIQAVLNVNGLNFKNASQASLGIEEVDDGDAHQPSSKANASSQGSSRNPQAQGFTQGYGVSLESLIEDDSSEQGSPNYDNPSPFRRIGARFGYGQSQGQTSYAANSGYQGSESTANSAANGSSNEGQESSLAASEERNWGCQIASNTDEYALKAKAEEGTPEADLVKSIDTYFKSHKNSSYQSAVPLSEQRLPGKIVAFSNIKHGLSEAEALGNASKAVASALAAYKEKRHEQAQRIKASQNTLGLDDGHLDGESNGSTLACCATGEISSNAEQSFADFVDEAGRAFDEEAATFNAHNSAKGRGPTAILGWNTAAASDDFGAHESGAGAANKEAPESSLDSASLGALGVSSHAYSPQYGVAANEELTKTIASDRDLIYLRNHGGRLPSTYSSSNILSDLIDDEGDDKSAFTRGSDFGLSEAQRRIRSLYTDNGESKGISLNALQNQAHFLNLVASNIALVEVEQRYFLVRCSELYYSLLEEKYKNQVLKDQVVSEEINLPFAIRCDSDLIKAFKQKDVQAAAMRCGFTVKSSLPRGCIELIKIPKLIAGSNLAQVASSALHLISAATNTINSEGQCPQQLVQVLARAKEMVINTEYDAKQLISRVKSVADLLAMSEQSGLRELDLMAMAAQMLKK